jgi:hypothetical protein
MTANQTIDLVKKLIKPSRFGVGLTTNDEQTHFVIWTVKNGQYFKHTLPIEFTNEERLEAHVVGFCDTHR